MAKTTRKTKSTHGGKRKGAGRKTEFPGKKRKLSVALTFETHQAMRRVARERRLTVSDAAEAAFRLYTGKDDEGD